MKTTLTEDLVVERYAVFAEMAWLERRPELSVICRLAREAGGQISASVVQAALPRLIEAGAVNLIRWCADLGLTDRWGSLTALGEDAADTGEAPVPEQGVYDFWVTDHVLVGARLLHAERLTTDRDRNVAELGPIPVKPVFDTLFCSVVRSEKRFVLRSFPSVAGAEAGAYRRPSRARCQVVWELDWDQDLSRVRITGFLDVHAEQVPVRHDPEDVEIDLWRLAESWATGPLRRHGTWSAQSRQLIVAPAGRTPAEQDSFRQDLDLGTVDVPGFGEWNHVRLTGVPIGPGDGEAAQRWAMARLDRRLQGDEVRRGRSAVRALFADLTEDTPLEAFQPVLPGHDALLATYAPQPEVFWRLAAPVDLAPAGPRPEELQPMRVGATAPGLAESAPGLAESAPGLAETIWVPYRCGWSMQTLVRRLVGPQGARRFLLVDRFVRGAGNLVSLEVLTAALTESEQLDFEVWTGNEVDDDTITEITEITGSRPRRYQEVFGRSDLPHDRYVVVIPRTGPPFGWQFSNSPLDARVADGADAWPQSPLRWRDLTGVRLSVEQLRPPMAAWARERPR